MITLQMLEVKVFKISERTQTITCHLPLTPNASLMWFGFSEEGQLSAYDTKVGHVGTLIMNDLIPLPCSLEK